MTPPVPRKLDLRKDSRLRIEWSDGSESLYPLGYLRRMCPCAACRTLREGADPHQLLRPAAADPPEDAGGIPQPKSLSLSVLPRHFASDADSIHVTAAELVGNYALKIDWSDGHASGIYSFAYLREIAR